MAITDNFGNPQGFLGRLMLGAGFSFATLAQKGNLFCVIAVKQE